MPRRPNARSSLAASARQMLARLDAEAMPLETAGACTPEETERWRKIQMHRLELLVRACWGDAATGDLAAIEQARRLLADQVRMMGIEAKAESAAAETDMSEVAELMRLAGYEVRRIEDGTSRTETIEASGTELDGSEGAGEIC